MTFTPPRLSPEIPEWRRSGRFFLLAIALHGAVLFYPVQRVINMLATPPLTATIVKLEPAAVLPPAPPAKAPAVSPPSPSQRERRIATPRPVLAIAPQQASAPVTFSVPEPVAAPPAPPSAPVSNHAPPAAISAARFDAAYLHNPRPNYPAASRRLGEEGKVLLKVRVSPDGQAAAVDIEKSSNFERLDEAARQAVARWRFVPAKRGDEAIEAWVIVPLVFRLND